MSLKARFVQQISFVVKGTLALPDFYGKLQVR
jgi:hypothetical protein